MKLLNNWLILIITIDNACAAPKIAGKTKAKLLEFRKKLVDVKFLATCCLFREILDIYATELSLKFESNSILCGDVSHAVATAVDSLEELLSNPDSLASLLKKNASMIITADGSVSQNLTKRNHNRRKNLKNCGH
jgi:hypothetical protein